MRKKNYNWFLLDSKNKDTYFFKMKWIFFTFSSVFLFLTSYSKEADPKITFLIAEREYLTEETLPAFARSHLIEEFRIAYCLADKEGETRHTLKNSEHIDDADLLFVSVRRRAFTTKVMNRIRIHIKKGKPVAGIRTASHAFQLRKEALPAGHQEWTKWDSEVIGGNYNGHLGKGLFCKIQSTSGGVNHEILNKVKLPFSTPATLYRNSPLPNSSMALLTGIVENHPPEPVAWINQTSSGGKVFYTSLGHVEDFKKPAFNQLLKNGIYWCIDQ